MPLPIYDTLDAVPEDQREDYVEHEGKFHPKVAVELAAEKKKRATLLTEKREEERLRKEAEEKVAAAERAAEARAKGISEDELKKINDAAALARKPIEEERDRLREENRKLKLTDRVQALYLAHGGMDDRIEDAMTSLASRTDLGDKDGIVFKDKDGSVTADDAAAFFAKHKLEKPWFYKGPNATGSGANGSTASGEAPPADQVKAKEAKRAQVANAF